MHGMPAYQARARAVSETGRIQVRDTRLRRDHGIIWINAHERFHVLCKGVQSIFAIVKSDLCSKHGQSTGKNIAIHDIEV